MSTAPLAAPDRALGAQAVALLRDLLRIPTVNPPGGELAAQELLSARLSAAGFDVHLLGATPDRPNLVARLDGAADGPVLGLLSHVDTVPAKADAWRHGPWDATVEGTRLFGRGALDMKCQTAAEVVAAIALAAHGWRPARGSLVVIAVVDEETGGDVGARWLVEHHPDLVRCDELINEGGGALLELGERRYLPICIGEKAARRLRVRCDGRAGHAAYPSVADNALTRLVAALHGLASAPPLTAETEVARRMLMGLGLDPADPSGAIAAVRTQDEVLGAIVEAASTVSIVPTMVSASEAVNVIPATAECRIDCRLPPGVSDATLLDHVMAALGPDAHVEVTQRIEGNASTPDSDLRVAIEAWLAREDPGVELTPFVQPGFTDSRTFRAAFPACVAYGFFPLWHTTLREYAQGIHAHDEQIDVRDVERAARFFRDLILARLGSAEVDDPHS